jgi:SHS2 domain-containing protein
MPHTADVIVAAWAPTREECIGQAATGLVSAFADLTGLTSHETITFTLPPGEDAEQLLQMLDEVIYVLEVRHVLPQRVDVTRDPDGGLTVTSQVVPVNAARPLGPAPKAISRHQLRFGPGGDGWSCAVTVDV